MEIVALNRIKVDAATQPRVELREELISQMAHDLRRAADLHPLPVVELYFDGVDYWIADGFHRVEAYRRTGRINIRARVTKGAAREAFLRALEINAGTPLSAADRKACAERMVSDPEWARWADSEIARRCGVERHAIAAIRKKHLGETTKMPQLTRHERKTVVEEPEKDKREGADVIPLHPAKEPEAAEEAPKKRRVVRGGKAYEVDTTNIGKTGRENKGKPKHLSTKAWAMLKGTAVAGDRNQQRQLERLPVSMQVQVARLVKDGKSASVKEAVDSIAAGAPVDDWGRAYQAIMQLPVDDRQRLCRQVLQESQAVAR